MTTEEMVEIIKKETVKALKWLETVKETEEDKTSEIYQRALSGWGELNRLCIKLGIEYIPT